MLAVVKLMGLLLMITVAFVNPTLLAIKIQ